MKTKTIGICSIVSFAFLALSPAWGDVIYDNGAGGAAGITSGTGSDPSAVATFRFMADDFIPTLSGTITSVSWTGLYSPSDTPPATDSFTLIFYSNIAGLPGVVLGTFPVGNVVGRTDSGFDIAPAFDIYNYTASVNQPVTSGTTYWLSIVNDTTSDVDDAWLWGRILGGLRAASSNQTTWETFEGEFDFVLEGNAIPEPTGALLVFGGFLAALRHRRRE